MGEFHRFSDLPEPLGDAIFAAAWRDETGWRDAPSRNCLRLVCRQARAAIDGAILKISVQIDRDNFAALDACTRAVGLGQFPQLREWSVSARPWFSKFGMQLQLLWPSGKVAAITRAAPPSLHTLELHGSGLGHSKVEAVAGVATVPTLRRLRLQETDMTWSQLRMLAQGFGPCLELLDLSYNRVDAYGAAALADLATERLRALRGLHLSHNDIADSGVRALVQVAWPALEVLRLDCNHLTQEATAALAGASGPRLPVLRELSLADNGLLDAAVGALVSVPWPALEVLNLDDSDISGIGAQVLADASMARLPALRCLHVGEALDVAGLAALARRPWPRLQELHLRHIQKSYGGRVREVEALGAAGAQHFPALEVLSLRDTYLCNGGVRELVQQAPWPALRSLDLSGTNLHVRGTKALAAASRSQLSALRALTLGGGDPVCGASIAALAGGDWRHLEALTFCAPRYSTRRKVSGGVDALAAAGAARFPALRSLTLEKLPVSLEQAAALAAAWPGARFTITPRPKPRFPRPRDAMLALRYFLVPAFVSWYHLWAVGALWWLLLLWSVLLAVHHVGVVWDAHSKAEG